MAVHFTCRSRDPGPRTRSRMSRMSSTRWSCRAGTKKSFVKVSGQSVNTPCADCPRLTPEMTVLIGGMRAMNVLRASGTTLLVCVDGCESSWKLLSAHLQPSEGGSDTDIVDPTLRLRTDATNTVPVVPFGRPGARVGASAENPKHRRGRVFRVM